MFSIRIASVHSLVILTSIWTVWTSGWSGKCLALFETTSVIKTLPPWCDSVEYETTDVIDMVGARPWARLAAQRLSSARWLTTPKMVNRGEILAQMERPPPYRTHQFDQYEPTVDYTAEPSNHASPWLTYTLYKSHTRVARPLLDSWATV